MIPNNLFTQLALLAISVGIILTYIKPAFTDIGEAQDVISTYRDEKGKVEEVNRKLSEKMNTLTNVSSVDHRRLLAYIPDKVDPIVVLRDITTIVDESGLILKDISDNGLESTKAVQSSAPSTNGVYNPYANSVSVEADGAPRVRTFSLSIEGSYGQIKKMFDTLEQNEYPLEAREVRIQSSEGGFLTAEITLHTYSLPETQGLFDSDTNRISYE